MCPVTLLDMRGLHQTQRVTLQLLLPHVLWTLRVKLLEMASSRIPQGTRMRSSRAPRCSIASQ